MCAKVKIGKTAGAMVALVMVMAAAGTSSWAKPIEENPCDPANGSYICDGTESQPVEGDVAMTGDDGVSLSPKPNLPNTGW